MMERGALERRAKIGDVWISRCGKDTRARFVALAYSLRRLRGSQQRREEEVQKGAGISPKTTHDGSSRRANAEPAAFPRLLSHRLNPSPPFAGSNPAATSDYTSPAAYRIK
ncbi:unnamed protein product [Lampetra planeri]